MQAPRPASEIVVPARNYREGVAEFANRWALGTLFSLMPQRIAEVPPLLWNMAREAARGGTEIPDQSRCYSAPDTFGGTCRNPSAATVLEAGRRGFFPWCHIGPLKWWTRKQRMVLFFENYHIPKRLRRDMRKGKHRVTFDQAFGDVMVACAAQRSYNSHALTWITPQIMQIYCDLFEQGHAHSFEVWNEEGELVGGGYGVSFGRVFYTESQFSIASNTSKMGFAVLNYHLAKWGYVLNDGKDFTPTIEAMGFQEIPSTKFSEILSKNTEIGEMGAPVGRWTVEADLKTVAHWNPGAKPNGLSVEAAE